MICLNCHVHSNIVTIMSSLSGGGYRCPVCECPAVGDLLSRDFAIKVEGSWIDLSTNSFWDTEDDIGEIMKGNTEKVLVRRVTRGGKVYHEIRVYYYTEEGYKPSKKGIVLPKDMMEEVIKLLVG